MSARRLLVTTTGCLTMLLTLALAPDALPAGASVGGTGTLRCTQVTGQLKFHPPLTTAGASSEVGSLKLSISGCTAKGGGVAPSDGLGSASFPLASSACSSLSSKSASAISLSIRWSPLEAGVTIVQFPGFARLKTDPPGVRLGGTGTSASGSYTGADGGASSSGKMLWSISASDIAGQCTSGKGLRTLAIASGIIILK